MTLLSVAESFATRKNPTPKVSDEEIELFWGWYKGRITTAQATKACGSKSTPSTTNAMFMRVVRHLLDGGDLVPTSMLTDFEKEWEK